MTKTQGGTPAKVLTTEELKSRLKEGSIVLWPYRGNVEEGTVLYTDDKQAHLCWLEGYRSRNDSVDFKDILSLHDKSAPEMSLHPFSGKGFLTKAGVRWQKKEKEAANA